MSEFLLLTGKIFPLYLIVAAGFVAAKRLEVHRETVATILIYTIAPVVVFYSVATAPASNAYLLLPVIFFVVGSLLALGFYWMSGFIWQSSERNLVGFVAGTGNTGYFGLPLVLALLGTHAQSVAILSALGAILFENTVGYYLIAKSHVSMKEALGKVARLPAIYAFAMGVIANKVGYHFSGPVTDAFANFRGAYIVFGMMIIGIGLASVTRAALDKTFTAITFAAKFVAYPAAIGLVIWLDASTFKLFDAQTYKVMMLLAIVPLASNTVAFATKLRAHPEKAAFTVLLSTVFALAFIPVFVAVFLK